MKNLSQWLLILILVCACIRGEENSWITLEKSILAIPEPATFNNNMDHYWSDTLRIHNELKSKFFAFDSKKKNKSSDITESVEDYQEVLNQIIKIYENNLNYLKEAEEFYKDRFHSNQRAEKVYSHTVLVKSVITRVLLAYTDQLDSKSAKLELEDSDDSKEELFYIQGIYMDYVDQLRIKIEEYDKKFWKYSFDMGDNEEKLKSLDEKVNERLNQDYGIVEFDTNSVSGTCTIENFIEDVNGRSLPRLAIFLDDEKISDSYDSNSKSLEELFNVRDAFVDSPKCRRENAKACVLKFNPTSQGVPRASRGVKIKKGSTIELRMNGEPFKNTYYFNRKNGRASGYSQSLSSTARQIEALSIGGHCKTERPQVCSISGRAGKFYIKRNGDRFTANLNTEQDAQNSLDQLIGFNLCQK
jgi:hypothetical protein